MIDKQQPLGRTLRLMAWTTCSVLAMVVSAPANAQTAAATSQAAAPDNSAEPALEEIVVTAQKRSENLQRVPVAVAAFTAATLKAANIQGSADLVNLTPSLRFQFGGPGGSVFLRGVGNSQQFAGAESEVQTYVDGVYYGSAGAAYLRFNNIERIEVDKGPQGTLFGRNATGGVIQIITRDPTQDFKLDVSAGYGKYDAKEADFYVAGGIGANIAADIAVHYDDHDGWGRNIVRNSDSFTARNFGVRSKLIFDFSDNVRGTFIGDYSRDRSDLGVAYVLQAGPWKLRAAEPNPPIPPAYTLTDNSPERTIVRRSGGSFKLEADMDAVKFVSITGARYTYSNGLLDADGTADTFLVGDETRKETQVSQEFQLLSNEPSRFQWILGAYLYYNKSKADPADLSGPFLARFGANEVYSLSYVTTKSAAAFGQATYDLTDSTHVTGGLRFTYDHRRQDASNTLFAANGQPVTPPPFLVLNLNNNPTAHFQALTGKFTIAQDVAERAMVYATYSRGFKSGTFNNFQVLSNPAPALRPETIDAFEGGLKADLLDRTLRVNLAGFYYKYRNLQVNRFIAFPAPSIVLANAAGSSIKGIDGELQFALARNTRLSGGAGYLDAKYTSFLAAPTYIINPITNPNPSGGFGGILNGSADAKGNTLPQAPKFSGFVSLFQGFDVGGGKLELNGTLSYQSRVNFTPDNQKVYSQGRSALLSASARWTAPDGKWDVMVWGRNLTDQNTVSNITISFVGARGVPNEPLTFGARVGVHF